MRDKGYNGYRNPSQFLIDHDNLGESREFKEINMISGEIEIN